LNGFVSPGRMPFLFKEVGFGVLVDMCLWKSINLNGFVSPGRMPFFLMGFLGEVGYFGFSLAFLRDGRSLVERLLILLKNLKFERICFARADAILSLGEACWWIYGLICVI
jgi:hypothetical protein